MSEKIEEQTAYGTVEYEVVECDSCGNTVSKEGAKRFVIGDYAGKQSWIHCGDELEFNNYRMGWCCEFCESEPAGFPRKKTSKQLTRTAKKTKAWLAGFDPVVLLIALSGIVMIIGAILIAIV